MDLKLFFDPVEIGLDENPHSFQSSIYINNGKMPDLDGMNIALIGLSEYRGIASDSNIESANAIRFKLYQHKKGYGEYGIVDLGNFRNGPQLEDTYLRLREVMVYLLSKQITPIFFAGSHDLDLSQMLAFQQMEQDVSMLNIDNRIDVGSGNSSSFTHLSKIFQNSHLFDFQQLGYQSYLVSSIDLELIDSLGFGSRRIGIVKNDLKEFEPVIRDADFLSYDLSANRLADMTGAINSTPFGFSGEEACQICWYAGQNEKMKSIGIYNYQKQLDNSWLQGASVVATMIWYFIEGFYHRKGDKSYLSNDYLIYDVQMQGNPDMIRFYKSKLTERWWIEVSSLEDMGPFSRKVRVSCNYSDYLQAQNGEIPDKWFEAVRKS